MGLFINPYQQAATAAWSHISASAEGIQLNFSALAAAMPSAGMLCLDGVSPFRAKDSYRVVSLRSDRIDGRTYFDHLLLLNAGALSWKVPGWAEIWAERNRCADMVIQNLRDGTYMVVLGKRSSAATRMRMWQCGIWQKKWFSKPSLPIAVKEELAIVPLPNTINIGFKEYTSDFLDAIRWAYLFRAAPFSGETANRYGFTLPKGLRNQNQFGRALIQPPLSVAGFEKALAVLGILLEALREEMPITPLF